MRERRLKASKADKDRQKSRYKKIRASRLPVDTHTHRQDDAAGGADKVTPKQNITNTTHKPNTNHTMLKHTHTHTHT